MLLMGYLYGIRSEQRLEEKNKVPDEAASSVNRVRGFCDNQIDEKIIQEILRQTVEKKKLVGSEILYTDERRAVHLLKTWRFSAGCNFLAFWG